jgi:hypothetical protein
VAPQVTGYRLSIRFGQKEFCLVPDSPALTFGRGRRCTIRLPSDDLDVSRHAGTIRSDNGLWLVANESTTRPLDIVLDGTAYSLSPRTPDSFSEWAISPSPPDLEVRVYGNYGPYRLTVTNHAYRSSPSSDAPPDHIDDDSTTDLPEPTDRERVLLAAKFLSLPVPGDAIGDRDAAALANGVLPEVAHVTPKALEDVVGKWRRRLQERLNVVGIDGQANINVLGRKLLSLGVIRQEDGKRLGGADSTRS